MRRLSEVKSPGVSKMRFFAAMVRGESMNGLEYCVIGCKGELLDHKVKELSAERWEVCQVFQEPPSYYRVFAQRETLPAVQEKVPKSSRFKGVSWRKDVGKWMAYIHLKGGKKVHLGYFDREEDAAKAHQAECERLKGAPDPCRDENCNSSS